jgi:hypothetical protein
MRGGECLDCFPEFNNQIASPVPPDSWSHLLRRPSGYSLSLSAVHNSLVKTHALGRHLSSQLSFRRWMHATRGCSDSQSPFCCWMQAIQGYSDGQSSNQDMRCLAGILATFHSEGIQALLRATPLHLCSPVEKHALEQSTILSLSDTRYTTQSGSQLGN